MFILQGLDHFNYQSRKVNYRSLLKSFTLHIALIGIPIETFSYFEFNSYITQNYIDYFSIRMDVTAIKRITKHILCLQIYLLQKLYTSLKFNWWNIIYNIF